MPLPSRRNLLLALFGVVGVTTLFFARRSIVNLFGKVVTAGKELAFKASLPERARSFSDTMLQVAREEALDPYLIFALGDRESLWGDALSPRGPAGTGDSGHGHGLMQIDDGSFGPWLVSNDWTNPYVNVKKGAKILKAKLAFFTGRSAAKGLTDGQYVTLSAAAAERRGVPPGKYPDPRPLTGKALWEAAIAAYNTGEGNVLMSLVAGKPAQFTTAKGDYVADVSNRGAQAAAKLT
jgi:hypothetical protein